MGRSDAATVLVLPNGTTLDRRALSKVRRGECGHEYVERRPAAGVVALRHGGWYRYGFRLGVTRAQRATVRIALPGGPYPKAIDDTSWCLATPLTAAVTPDEHAGLLL